MFYFYRFLIYLAKSGLYLVNQVIFVSLKWCFLFPSLKERFMSYKHGWNSWIDDLVVPHNLEKDMITYQMLPKD